VSTFGPSEAVVDSRIIGDDVERWLLVIAGFLLKAAELKRATRECSAVGPNLIKATMRKPEGL
jgi:hypothetical protein